MGAGATGQEPESKEFLTVSIKGKDNRRVIYSQRLSGASYVQPPGTPSQPIARVTNTEKRRGSQSPKLTAWLGWNGRKRSSGWDAS